jgi:hypothetical protein
MERIMKYLGAFLLFQSTELVTAIGKYEVPRRFANP